MIRQYLVPARPSRGTPWWIALVLVACCLGARSSQAARPNIILIVADDLGWTDLACFGSHYYRTPNIDRLCRAGMKFTAAYTCGPNCAPTRACLMSGMYTPRHGIYTVGSGARGKEKFRRLVPVKNETTLAPSFLTLAEVLHDAGYTTAHMGKWHLGEPGSAGPCEQGFDLNVGGNHSGSPRGGYFGPFTKNPQLPVVPAGTNLTDLLSREAVRFLHAQRDKPFFLYLPFYAVHSPHQAKKDLIAEYTQRKPWGGHNNPTYAAMIETVDTGVGSILAELEALRLTEKTIVIFYSDNGGVGGYAEAGVKGTRGVTSQAPLRGGKGMLYEGGIRVPMIVRWPGVTQPGSVCAAPVITLDFYPTLAEIAQVKTILPKRLDGVSIVPLLQGESLPPRKLFWHFPGYLQGNAKLGSWRTTPAGAIQTEGWKLIEFFEDNHTELYNLAEDIGEDHDLVEQQPRKAAELKKALHTWRQRVHAPMPTPK